MLTLKVQSGDKKLSPFLFLEREKANKKAANSLS